ncbi:MFS transporter [Vulcaniibacterium tengchongense]|uniref:Putative MFS family arabinose efflux permease n=1 Tax=Vulcaniibacterium tengchongense TaxID=1273429 RepID=A0A3N4VV71_9GAMM|nr:MFS transporter [Vulcaniibacterium tengchongense]RPE80947.1 putative MFS family arabinose efflux permease [Vulcaniibacterium tengchongense]
MPLSLLLLSAAGFTVLTTEFILVGLLPPLARDLGVSVSAAGLLVTLFGLTIAASGPFLTAYFSRFERKRLFVAVLLAFAAANALAALAPNIGVMALARLLPALGVPVFWALASETAVDLAGEARAGRAISVISFGVICATVLGVPIGTLLADAFGWRAAFTALAAMSLGKAALLQAFLPDVRPRQAPAPLRGQLRVLREARVLGHVLLSILLFTGMFTAYTYLADLLERGAGFDGGTVGWTLMGFGAVGLIGNALGGRLVDRRPLGATLLFGAPLAFALLATAPAIGSLPALAAVLALWGVTQSALFIVSHVRVMKSAPEAPAFAASLNISGANLGIALGAVAGGRVIDAVGVVGVGYAAAAIVAAAMALAAVLALAPVRAARPQADGRAA